MRSQHGLTITESIIIILIIAIIVAIAVPNFGDSNTRSPVSRAKSDMRSLATAIETYYVDHKRYPAMTPLSDWIPKGKHDKLRKIGGGALSVPAAGSYPHKTQAGLTTPIAYVTSLFHDPFFPLADNTPFVYAANDEWWILVSCGPDEDYDVVNPPAVLRGREEEIRARLSAATYDPTKRHGVGW